MSWLRSDMPIDLWRGDLTFFPSQYDTSPVMEKRGVGWEEVVEAIAPSIGAFCAINKRLLPYFIASSLVTAQLVGKTLAANLAIGGDGYGVQRSKSHVTQTSLMIFDIDDVDVRVMSNTICTLEQSDISYLMYTTYSHGKQGDVRLRFVVPIDQSLGADEYQHAHDWLNQELFEDSADKSGNRFYQCQGVWGCPPNRAHLARRRLSGSGVLGVPVYCLQVRQPRDKELVKISPIDDRSLQMIRAIYDRSPDVELLKKLKFSRKVKDGEGRESTTLKLAGALRVRGFSHEQVVRLCRTWNSRFCLPPLDDKLVLDRCGRYCHVTNNAFYSAETFARDIAVELLARDIKEQGQILVRDDKTVCFEYLRLHHPEQCLALGFPVESEVY